MNDEQNSVARREFSKRLRSMMVEAGFNQSDLARAASKHLPKGKEMGRDSVSGYVRGRSIPTPVFLNAIAQSLRCKPEDLIPELMMAADSYNESKYSLNAVAGDPRMVWLKINNAVPVEAALKILEIMQSVEKK